jgi:hypothetical protein
MNLPDSIQNYLSKKSIGRWKIEHEPTNLYNNIIVIPALDEYFFINDLIDSLQQNDYEYLSDTLIIVVINNSAEDDTRVINENQKTIEILRDKINNPDFRLNMKWINASSKGNELPNKSAGVGLARKIGMDLALKYFNYDNHRKNILISLDADCKVSNNYLKSIVNSFNNFPIHAAVVDFEHLLPEDPTFKSAIINYEIFLRYYVLGLKYASSRFAYLSVGSTIICDAFSYVKIGGMNKRKGGEDFYFLQKLAKITDIKTIKSTKVFPSPRISERVPFGTGPRIQRFINECKDEYLLYEPKIFEVLKLWLAEYFNTDLNMKSISRLLKNAGEINKGLQNFLNLNMFTSDWSNILKNSKSDLQIKNQKNLWMDGFKTLKLVHYLRDNYYPSISMFEAMNILFRKMNLHPEFLSNEKIPPIDIQIKYLELLRKHSVA